jgi:hypothetical protein
MFSPVYSAPRAKQPVLFLASLSLQVGLVTLLCLIPPAGKHGCCLRKDELHAAMTTPIYFQPPAPALSDAKPSLGLAKPDSTPALPSAAKPLELRPAEAQLAEAKPAEASTAAATADTNRGGVGSDAVSPFPAWQMSSNSGMNGFHHQVKKALPVFTPQPEILHGEFPEPARGKELVLNVVISDEGSVVAVEVLQGIGYGVEQSIVETLKRWIYVPAKYNGMSIASQQELRFQFPG